MTPQAQINIQNDKLLLSGIIKFSNAVQIKQQGENLISTAKAENIIIDLHGIETSDSSGLAILSAWMRTAKKFKKKLTFVNIPPLLWDLSRVSGLDTILPIQYR